jgi:hypothetical protein
MGLAWGSAILRHTRRLPARNWRFPQEPSSALDQRNLKPHSFAAILADLKYRQKGFLGNVDLTDALHPLFAFFLLFQELALTADVSSVALGDHILA